MTPQADFWFKGWWRLLMKECEPYELLARPVFTPEKHKQLTKIRVRMAKAWKRQDPPR